MLDESKVDSKRPLYLFPVRREREGTVLDFDKSLLVYNLHRLERPVRTIVVVQNFESVWWLHQAGIPGVVALMDSDCTIEQARAASAHIDPATRVVILPTGDRAGEAFAERMFVMLGRNRWVRCIELAEDLHPTDVPPSELVARLPV